MFLSHDRIVIIHWLIANQEPEWLSYSGGHFLFVVGNKFDPIRGVYKSVSCLLKLVVFECSLKLHDLIFY